MASDENYQEADRRYQNLKVNGHEHQRYPAFACHYGVLFAVKINPKKRFLCFTVKYVSDAMHRITSRICRVRAVDSDRPTSVSMTMYAVKQAGHFGRSSKIALDASHPLVFKHRRTNGRKREAPSVAHVPVATLLAALRSTVQHR